MSFDNKIGKNDEIISKTIAKTTTTETRGKVASSQNILMNHRQKKNPTLVSLHHNLCRCERSLSEFQFRVNNYELILEHTSI